jgi:hypothetical protein
MYVTDFCTMIVTFLAHARVPASRNCNSSLESQAESGTDILKPVVYGCSFVRRIAFGATA